MCHKRNKNDQPSPAGYSPPLRTWSNPLHPTAPKRQCAKEGEQLLCILIPPSRHGFLEDHCQPAAGAAPSARQCQSRRLFIPFHPFLSQTAQRNHQTGCTSPRFRCQQSSSHHLSASPKAQQTEGTWSRRSSCSRASHGGNSRSSKHLGEKAEDAAQGARLRFSPNAEFANAAPFG